MAGQTDEQIEIALRHPLIDTGRSLAPPQAPGIIKGQVGVCVVGTGWGAVHCRLIRQVQPTAKLFVCGRNPEKTAQHARAVGAEAMFTSLEEAAADPRVQACTLALPHDLHRQAVETVVGLGKNGLGEKPIAAKLADADCSFRLASSTNRSAMG